MQASFLDDEPLKSPIPGLPRPAYLTGSLAGDVGLDPLGLVTLDWLRLFDFLPEPLANPLTDVLQELASPLIGSNSPQRKLMWMREAEIKHARLAMLAAAGWPLAELWHGPLAAVTALPFELDVTQGRSLSVLNGGLDEVWPSLLLFTLGATAVELSTLDQVYGLTATGKTMSREGRGLVMKTYIPGDCGFDPLGLYNWYGAQPPAMVQLRAESDPEYAMRWNTFNRKQMEEAEIKNGRLAMLAITGFAMQEAVTGMPVVDQTPIFFTGFWDVLAPGALSSITGIEVR